MRGKLKDKTNDLVTHARNLRKTYTYSERYLWYRLKNRQLMGLKFRRQYPYKRFIFDFYCPELKLVIEIDGSSHDELKYDYDNYREIKIINNGFYILRFTEYEVKRNINNVLQTIINFMMNI